MQYFQLFCAWKALRFAVAAHVRLDEQKRARSRRVNASKVRSRSEDSANLSLHMHSLLGTRERTRKKECIREKERRKGEEPFKKPITVVQYSWFCFSTHVTRRKEGPPSSCTRHRRSSSHAWLVRWAAPPLAGDHHSLARRAEALGKNAFLHMSALCA